MKGHRISKCAIEVKNESFYTWFNIVLHLLFLFERQR
jgi:hypothetical protein